MLAVFATVAGAIAHLSPDCPRNSLHSFSARPSRPSTAFTACTVRSRSASQFRQCFGAFGVDPLGLLSEMLIISQLLRRQLAALAPGDQSP